VEGRGDRELVVAVVGVVDEGTGQVEHPVYVAAVPGEATLVSASAIGMSVEDLLDQRMGREDRWCRHGRSLSE
jgi:hypothetical protein